MSEHAARLLLVEDDPTNRLLVRAVLDRAADADVRAAHVEEAATLAAARQALREATPAVVMLDVRLPDGSGLDLARELIAGAPTALGEPGATRPRIVIMSASVLPAERQAALDAGCDAFLAKPFRPSDLVQLLAGWIAAAA